MNYQSKYFEFFTESDTENNCKLEVDWYIIKDHQHSKICGEYLYYVDIEKCKRTPQYNWFVFSIILFGTMFYSKIRTTKTGMSKLYKFKLENEK